MAAERQPGDYALSSQHASGRSESKELAGSCHGGSKLQVSLSSCSVNGEESSSDESTEVLKKDIQELAKRRESKEDMSNIVLDWSNLSMRAADNLSEVEYQGLKPHLAVSRFSEDQTAEGLHFEEHYVRAPAGGRSRRESTRNISLRESPVCKLEKQLRRRPASERHFPASHQHITVPHREHFLPFEFRVPWQATSLLPSGGHRGPHSSEHSCQEEETKTVHGFPTRQPATRTKSRVEAALHAGPQRVGEIATAPVPADDMAGAPSEEDGLCALQYAASTGHVESYENKTTSSLPERQAPTFEPIAPASAVALSAAGGSAAGESAASESAAGESAASESAAGESAAGGESTEKQTKSREGVITPRHGAPEVWLEKPKATASVVRPEGAVQTPGALTPEVADEVEADYLAAYDDEDEEREKYVHWYQRGLLQKDLSSVGHSRAPAVKTYAKLFLPSSDLVKRVSRNYDHVRAINMITSAVALRLEFTENYAFFDSPCVLPPTTSPTDTWGSREPRFCPDQAPIYPNLNGVITFEEGVIRVYSDLSLANPAHTNLQQDVKHETVDGQGEPKGSAPVGEMVATWPNIISVRGANLPTVSEYISALKKLMTVVQDPACKSVCFQRLKYLDERFSFHILFNGPEELDEVRNNNHRDFYNVRKVDTHVHHSACMPQKHLLRFIRRKYRMNGDEKVCRNASGKELTLVELFQEQIGVSAWEASIDKLDVHAINSCFHRFDLFNSKYNPFGTALLREVFLKTDNMLQGKYLAEITQEVIEDLEAAKYQQVEWRISIYGHSRDEWLKLARWVNNHKLFSKRVRWVIQVPRLYYIAKAKNKVGSMAEFLRNVFEPVVEAVLRPQDHPEIFKMLWQVVAWDSVDDESVVSKFTMDGGNLPVPEEWTRDDNPPYAYWCYYMYANIRTINVLLQARGMNPKTFRPHCGETGSISHLASAGLLADGINHGIMLRKSPVLQYLYYLWQIPIAASPLSNNALFHEISKSPFHTFFKIGLNLSLSSDDPLMFHFTDEALLEEYSVCAHIWKLSAVDLCEIARSSVLQSNFEPQFKRHWVGANYQKKGPKGNDIRATNVPDIRLAYRDETLREELKYLRDVILQAENNYD